MPWGARIIGLNDVLGVLENLTLAYDNNVVYVVGPTVHYAVYHELGTSKMEARPFAKPAAERVQHNVSNYVDRYATESSEQAILQAVAVGVQEEMVRIITEKGIVDTGAMRASVSIARVS